MSAADELDEARALATDACGRIAEFWGFTRTMGRAFGLLYLSREPLPQAEIQARLGISAGSASMTLAALGRWGVVHKIWVRGQRREHYQAETDFWKMISGVLNERERREISAAVDVVSRAEASARAAQARRPRRRPGRRRLRRRARRAPRRDLPQRRDHARHAARAAHARRRPLPRRPQGRRPGPAPPAEPPPARAQRRRR